MSDDTSTVSSSLQEAPFHDTLGVCTYLLDHGADPLIADDGGNNCLHYLSSLDSGITLTRLFLNRVRELHGDAGLRAGLLAQNDSGNVPLHYVLSGTFDELEHVQILELLLQACPDALTIRNKACTASGCLVECSCSGQTPLQLFVPGTFGDPALLPAITATLATYGAAPEAPTVLKTDAAGWQVMCPDVTQGKGEQSAVPMLVQHAVPDKCQGMMAHKGRVFKVRAHKDLGAGPKRTLLTSLCSPACVST